MVGDAVTVLPVVAESAVFGAHVTPVMPAGMVKVEGAPAHAVTEEGK